VRYAISQHRRKNEKSTTQELMQRSTREGSYEACTKGSLQNETEGQPWANELEINGQKMVQRPESYR